MHFFSNHVQYVLSSIGLLDSATIHTEGEIQMNKKTPHFPLLITFCEENPRIETTASSIFGRPQTTDGWLGRRPRFCQSRTTTTAAAAALAKVGILI